MILLRLSMTDLNSIIAALRVKEALLDGIGNPHSTDYGNLTSCLRSVQRVDLEGFLLVGIPTKGKQG